MDQIQVVDQTVPVGEHEAALNITFMSQNGSLIDPVSWDARDEDLFAWAAEAIRNGNVRGIDQRAAVDFDGYLVERIAEKDGLPRRLMIRPKMTFGC
jgi:hypothetical protein